MISFWNKWMSNILLEPLIFLWIYHFYISLWISCFRIFKRINIKFGERGLAINYIQTRIEEISFVLLIELILKLIFLFFLGNQSPFWCPNTHCLLRFCLLHQFDCYDVIDNCRHHCPKFVGQGNKYFSFFIIDTY